MRIIQSLIAAAVLGLATLAPQPLAAQQEVENPEGTWRHLTSGTVFPRFLGAAERGSITEFDEGGTDVGVGYSMRTPDGVLVLTIYVYPQIEGWTCREAYEDAKRAIDEYHGAQLLTETMKPSPGGSRSGAAYYARYDIPAGAMKPGYPELVSDLYQYCSQNTGQLVKYRASWSGTSDDFPDVGALMQQVGWGQSLD